MAKNAYELRLEILRFSQERLSEKHKDDLLAWKNNPDDWSTRPSYPDLRDVLEDAHELKLFIETK